ncbi:unnamed protein product [Meganyctiphanes norvegica]|uniref:Uncharacterized protein n=1 Tax=Meganyctiphanes norvegica TaxID=48144 RepID=A0AAV2RBD9_MEGNR
MVAGFVLIALGFSATCERHRNNSLSIPYGHLSPEVSTHELNAGTYVPYRPYDHRSFPTWLSQMPDSRDTYQLTQQRQQTHGQQISHQLSQHDQLTHTQDAYQLIQQDQLTGGQQNTCQLTQQNQLQQNSLQEPIQQLTNSELSYISLDLVKDEMDFTPEGL